MFINNKTAAMFGLDARIALAIFGALSIITGAALYSAIGNAKATALLTEMQEVSKAWESYYLDTGQNLPQNSLDSAQDGFYTLKIKRLVEKDTETNWNGPYLPYVATHDYRLQLTIYPGGIGMTMLNNNNTWGDSNTYIADGKCLSKQLCYAWVSFCSIPNGSMAVTIDNSIDGGDGDTEGKFRWYKGAGGGYCYFLQVAPVKNPND